MAGRVPRNAYTASVVVVLEPDSPHRPWFSGP